MDAVWANTWRTGVEGWDRNRNVCSSNHFDTYFSLSVKNSAITARESNDLIENAGVAGATKERLLRYLGQTKRNGGSRASLALEELRSRASDIPDEAVETFLKDVFEVADTIDIESDHGRGMFDLADNSLRIHWLLNRVVFDRFSLKKRSEIMRATIPSASLSWSVSLSDRLHRSDVDGHENSSPREVMVDDDTAKWAYDLSLDLLRTAAQDGTLSERHDLMSLLFRWRDRAGIIEARQWTDEKLASTEFVVAAARAAVRTSWSQGMGGFGFLGDTVSTRHIFVELEQYRELVDIDRLRSRVDELLASDQINDEQRATLRKFNDTPEREPRSAVKD